MAIATLAPAICCLVLPRIKFSKLSIAFLASRVAFWAQNDLFTDEFFRTRGFFFGGVCKRSIYGGFNLWAISLSSAQPVAIIPAPSSTPLNFEQTRDITILCFVYLTQELYVNLHPWGLRAYTFDYKQRNRSLLFINIWFKNSEFRVWMLGMCVDQWHSILTESKMCQRCHFKRLRSN